MGNSEEEINENCKRIKCDYIENECKNMHDYLMIYAQTDIDCMKEPIENMLKVYFKYGIDLLSDHATIQSTVLPILMSYTPPINTLLCQIQKLSSCYVREFVEVSAAFSQNTKRLE